MTTNVVDQLSFEEQELKKKNELIELRNIIVKHLSESSKTEDDLIKLIPNAKYEQILNVLKTLLSLKLITKDGFPVKYTISKEISDTLLERKQLFEKDKNLIRIAMIIESKGSDKGSLRKAMEEMIKALKNDKNYFVYNASLADIVVHDDLFSTYISAEVSCSTLLDLFRLVFFYGATSLEILKPSKTTITIADLQQTSALLVDMIHGHVEMIYDLKKQVEALSRLR